jgi:glycosyltransferase involved in cell wall biosynthesis
VAGRPCVGFFLQTVTQLISPAAMSGLLDLASQLAQDAPDVAVLVREHPGHRIDTGHLERLSSPNLILTPPERYSLADVLSACDTVVSICSTTLLEAAALGTPPVILNQTSLPRYMPDLARIGAGIETRDPAIARHEVLRLLRDPDARERFARGMERVREHFFAGADTRAPDRIVGLVRELGSEASR